MPQGRQNQLLLSIHVPVSPNKCVFKTDDDWLFYAECSLFLDGLAMPEILTKSTVRKKTRLFLRNKVTLSELWAETKLASSKTETSLYPCEQRSSTTRFIKGKAIKFFHVKFATYIATKLLVCIRIGNVRLRVTLAENVTITRE